MGLALTQVITESRASGGQVIDGSLRFDGSSTTLTRTPGSASNQKTWTFSVWLKRGTLGANQGIFCPVLGGDGSNESQIRFYSDDRIQIYDSGGSPDKANIIPTQKFRDPSAWYHVVIACDTTQSTAADRMKFYVNGTQVEDFDTTQWPDLNENLGWNNTSRHDIGRYAAGSSAYFPGYMSNFYWIDGQQLDASYFGFTDPLTNTWRPKKYTGTFGTNGFYLPMDGNTSIGEDKSGNGNDFTPVEFGGSNSIEKATGALPILNTTNGGTTATVGVRTDSNVGAAASCVLAIPMVGTVDDVSNQVDGGSSTKTITKGNNVDAGSEKYNFYSASHRFNGSTDYLDVAASSDFAFGTGDFTIECWIYSGVNSLDTYYRRIYMTDGPTGNAAGNFQIAITPTSGVINLWENTGELDVDGTTDVTNQKWNHIAAVRSGTTLKLYVNGVEELSTTYSTSVTANSGSPRPRIGNFNGSSGGGDFDGYMQDLRVYNGVAKYTSNFIPAATNPDILPDTPSGVAGGSALATLSESTTGGSVYFDGSGDYLSLANDTDFDVAAGDFTAEGYFYFTNQSSTGTCFFGKWADTPGRNFGFVHIKSDNKYRFSWSSNGTDETLYTTSVGYPGDVNRWVHLAVVRNGTTLKIYRDGEEILSSSIGSSTIYNSSTSFMVGRFESNTNYDYSGWISNFRFVKGTAVYTAEFTPPTSPLTNITNTKLLCCKNSSSATDSVVTPGTITANGNTVGNKFRPFQGEDINLVRGKDSGYATYLPFGNDQTYHNGNLQLKTVSPGYGRFTYANIAIPDDEKFFIEYTVTDTGASNDVALGVDNGNSWSTYTHASLSSSNSIDGDYRAYRSGGGTFVGSTYTSGTPGISFADGDIIGTAIDRVNDEISYYKNGVKVYTHSIASSPSTGNYYPSVGTFTGTADVTINAGQKPFKYAPPEGFKTLCLANLPRPTEAAVRPDKYVGIVTYTGNNLQQPITGLGFQPSFVWVKCRNQNSTNHILQDSVRGVQNYLTSDTNVVEGTSDGTIISFDSDGFTIGAGNPSVPVNNDGDDFVAWCWRAGIGTVSNSDGSINSVVSANQDSGFSVVTYVASGTDNDTVGHGLSQKPEFWAVKSRDGTRDWICYTEKIDDSLDFMHFNNTESKADSSANAPTSTVFSIYGSDINTLNEDCVAYLWHSVEGFSKFGKYTGNGNADGPLITCGFRPAWVMVKATSFTNVYTGWQMWDSARNKYNVANLPLYANDDDKEGTNGQGDVELTSHLIDMVSNGFKIRTSNQICNKSGETYIFAAFAEAPTNNLYGGQANAR